MINWTQNNQGCPQCQSIFYRMLRCKKSERVSGSLLKKKSDHLTGKESSWWKHNGRIENGKKARKYFPVNFYVLLDFEIVETWANFGDKSLVGEKPFQRLSRKRKRPWFKVRRNADKMSTKHLLMQEPIFFFLTPRSWLQWSLIHHAMIPLAMGLHLLLMALQVSGDILLHF